MKRTAKEIARFGRNGDTELLHVSKKELAALRGIGSFTGRRVTQNPKTGLPEAFSFGDLDLTSLIPAIVGLGGAALTGGAMSPLTAGLISGAATTATTGGDLQRGLLAGLSGGAMAGLGQGLVGVHGAGAGAAAASQPAMGAGMGAGVNAANPMFGAGRGALDAGVMSGMDGVGSDIAVNNMMGSGLDGAAGDMASTYAVGGDGGMGMGLDGPAGDTASTYATQGAGAAGAGTPWADQFMGDKLWTRTVPGLMSLGYTLDNAYQPKVDMPGMEEDNGFSQKEKRMERDYLGPAQDPYYAMTGSGEPRYFSEPRFNFAEGGRAFMDMPRKQVDRLSQQSTFGMPNVDTLNKREWRERILVDKEGRKKDRDYEKANKPIQMAGGGIVGLPQGKQQDSGILKAVRAIRSRYRSKQQALEDMKVQGSFINRLGIRDPNDPIMQYAFGYTEKQGKKKGPQDRIITPLDRQVPRMAHGGSVHGQGDGMSDSIPARLGDGEFVVAADVVSGLGNGSSEAGAQQLDNMMSRVRAARTGSAKQAPTINPRKVLPR